MANQLPALPCGANDGSTPVLDASSGGTIAMDHLGPIVGAWEEVFARVDADARGRRKRTDRRRIDAQ